jgi:hypothetical protein
MKISQAISIALHLLSVFIFGFLGAAFLAIYYFPSAVNLPYLFFKTSFSLYIGLTLACFAVLLLIVMGFISRKSYVTLEMKGPKTEVDPDIVRSFLEEYWRGCFKGNLPKIDVALDSQNQIEIITEGLPASFKTEENLQLFEKEVGFLLAHHLGYKKKFYFSFKI